MTNQNHMYIYIMTFNKCAGSLKLFVEILKFISLINDGYVVLNSDKVTGGGGGRV